MIIKMILWRVNPSLKINKFGCTYAFSISGYPSLGKSSAKKSHEVFTEKEAFIIDYASQAA